MAPAWRNRGDPFADFLLGFPQNTSRTVGSGQAYMRQNYYAGYVQDEWRVVPRLTLNLGLRYEYAAPYTEARRQPVEPGLCDPAESAAPGACGPAGPSRIQQLRVRAWAWLAWRSWPIGTVFRAGYGIYPAPKSPWRLTTCCSTTCSTSSNETQRQPARRC